VMGKDALADDILVRQLGLRRTCEGARKSGRISCPPGNSNEFYVGTPDDAGR